MPPHCRVLLRNEDAHEAELAEFLDNLPGNVGLPIPVPRVGGDVLGGEPPGDVLQRDQIVG